MDDQSLRLVNFNAPESNTEPHKDLAQKGSAFGKIFSYFNAESSKNDTIKAVSELASSFEDLEGFVDLSIPAPPQRRPPSIPKTISPELTYSHFENIMGLRSQNSDQPHLSEMQEFLKTMTKASSTNNLTSHLSQINRFGDRCPLLNDILIAMKTNLDQWESLRSSPDKLKELKEVLKNQYAFLAHMSVDVGIALDALNVHPNSAFVTKLAFDNDLKTFLSKQSPLIDLNHYIQGKRALSDEAYMSISKSINEALILLMKAEPDLVKYPNEVAGKNLGLFDHIKSQPLYNRLPKKVVTSTAELFQASLRFSAEAAAKEKLVPLGTSNNNVSALRDFVTNIDPAEAETKLQTNQWMLCRSGGKLTLVDSENGILKRTELGPVYTEIVNGARVVSKNQTEGLGRSISNNLFMVKGRVTNLSVILEDLELKALKPANKPEAFFKQNKDDKETPGMIAAEKFMWDLATELGMDDFAPTKATEMRNRAQIIGVDQTSLSNQAFVNPKGEIVESKTVQPGVKGIFQQSAGNKSWDEFLSNPAVGPARSQIAKAAVTSMVLGMFDFHRDNLKIDDKGNINFFDNFRSFPNTNKFLNRSGDRLVSPYRTPLLAAKASYEDLLPQERQEIKNQLAIYKSKLTKQYGEPASAIEKFLNRPDTISQLALLNPGSLDAQAALSAMIERVELLEQAIDNPKVKNIVELTMASSPAFKFNSALVFMSRLITEYPSPNNTSPLLQAPSKLHYLFSSRQPYEPAILDTSKVTTKELHRMQQKIFRYNDVGFIDVETLLKTMGECGIDPQEIKELCENPDLSFEEIAKTLAERNNTPSQTANVICVSNSKAIIKELFRESAIDTKDYGIRSSMSVVRLKNKEILKNQAIPILSSFDASFFDATHNLKPGNFLIELGLNDKEFLVINNGRETKKYEINLGAAVNKVQIKYRDTLMEALLPTLTFSEIKQWADRNSPSPHNIRNIENALAEIHKAKITVINLSSTNALRLCQNGFDMKVFINEVKNKEPPSFKVYIKKMGTTTSYDLDLNLFPGKVVLRSNHGALGPMDFREIGQLAFPGNFYMQLEKKYVEMELNGSTAPKNGWLMTSEDLVIKPGTKVSLFFKTNGLIQQQDYKFRPPSSYENPVGQLFNGEALLTEMKRKGYQPNYQNQFETVLEIINKVKTDKLVLKVVKNREEQDLLIKNLPMGKIIVIENISQNPPTFTKCTKDASGRLLIETYS